MAPSRRIALAMLLVLTASMPQLKAEPPAEQRGILFITSVDPDQPGLALLIEEARSKIQDGLDRPVHFDVEYLDPYLFTRTGENEAKATAFLQAKYAHQSFETIVTIGAQPLKFAEAYGPRLFPYAKIVSVLEAPAVEGQAPEALPGTTGVGVALNFIPTLELALSQNPGTRQVALVAGTSPDDDLKLQEAKKEFSTYAPKLKILDLSDNSVERLKLRLARLDSDCIIIYMDLTADVAGEAYISARLLPELARAANRPMYGISSEHVGAGVVGGSVIDMREVGRATGEAALRVLKGEKPESVPFTSSEFQRYVFDARELKRWGIENLPYGSKVLHQEYNPWTMYPWQFTGLALAVLLQALLIALLLRMSVQRRRAQHELTRMLAMEKLESSLAATLGQLPAGMVNAAIDRGFMRFIEFFGIDCISLFEFLPDKSLFRLLHYRSAPGTKLRLSRLKPEEFSWTTERLLQGQTVVIRSRADVPLEAEKVMSMAVQARLHSFAGVPLKAADRVFGALFFLSSKARDWDARLMTELQMIASIVGSGLERTRANAALTQSEQLNTAILASLPSLVAVLDMEGNITAVSSAPDVFAPNVSLGPDLLRVGGNYFEVCRKAEEQGSRYARAALRGVQEVSSGIRSRFEMEYPSVDAQDGGWFHMLAVPLVGRQGGVVVSHTDVTRRKLAELDLQESERRFRLMTDSAPMLVWMSGPDKMFTDFNQGWLEFTGKRVEDEAGEGWKSGIHPEDVKQYCADFNSAFDSRQPFRLEFRLRRFDGEYRWMVDRGVPRFRNDGTFAGYIGCCADATEQKEAELERAEIGGRLLQAQEEERSRIARELHDDINQKLGLLAIEIQQLQQSLPQLDERGQGELTRLFEATNRISADVQRLSHQLHSSRLDYLGLPAALRRLCEEFAAQHHISTECVIKEIPPQVTREVNLCLFRVAQECLSNTAKHSAARHVRLDLECYGAMIHMKVSDDGTGFNTEQAGSRHEPGLGLISMRERLRLVNGELTIHSRPGAGTQIAAVVPLPHVSSAEQTAGPESLRMTG